MHTRPPNDDNCVVVIDDDDTKSSNAHMQQQHNNEEEELEQQIKIQLQKQIEKQEQQQLEQQIKIQLEQQIAQLQRQQQLDTDSNRNENTSDKNSEDVSRNKRQTNIVNTNSFKPMNGINHQNNAPSGIPFPPGIFQFNQLSHAFPNTQGLYAFQPQHQQVQQVQPPPQPQTQQLQQSALLQSLMTLGGSRTMAPPLLPSTVPTSTMSTMSTPPPPPPPSIPSERVPTPTSGSTTIPNSTMLLNIFNSGGNSPSGVTKQQLLLQFVNNTTGNTGSNQANSSGDTTPGGRMVPVSPFNFVKNFPGGEQQISNTSLSPSTVTPNSGSVIDTLSNSLLEQQQHQLQQIHLRHFQQPGKEDGNSAHLVQLIPQITPPQSILRSLSSPSTPSIIGTSGQLVNLSAKKLVVSKKKKQEKLFQDQQEQLVSKPRTPMEELAHIMASLVAEEEIERELREYVISAATDACTANASEFHLNKQTHIGRIRKRANKKKEDMVEKVRNGSDTEESSTEEITSDGVDHYRKTILQEWNQIRDRYKWRWDWLQLRISILQHELEETNYELDQLHGTSSNMGFSSPDYLVPPVNNIKDKRLSLCVYPPQKRRVDVEENPVFSPEFRAITCATSRVPPLSGVTYEDIVSAMNIFSVGEYPPKRKLTKKRAKKRKRPAYLRVAIPAGTQQSVIEESVSNPDSVGPSAINEPSASAKMRTPKSNRKRATSTSKIKTPSSSGRRSRTSSNAAYHSQGSEYDINDVVIPWADIRSNFTIPDIKPVEIFTPEWRAVDNRKVEQEQQLRNNNGTSNTGGDGYRLIQTSSTNYETSSDEDISEERFCALHLVKELEERKRYFDIISQKKKKRKDEEQNEAEEHGQDIPMSGTTPAPYSTEVIHQIFVQTDPNALLESNTTQEQITASNEASSATLPTSSRRTTRESKYLQMVYNRSIDVKLESYIALPHANRGKTYGNYEEMKALDLERQRQQEQERLLWEQNHPQPTHTRKPIESYAVEDEVIYYDVDEVIPPDSEDEYIGMTSPSNRYRKTKKGTSTRNTSRASMLDDLDYLEEDDDEDFGVTSRPRKRSRSNSQNKTTPRKARTTPRGRRKKGFDIFGEIPTGPRQFWSVVNIVDTKIRLRPIEPPE